MESKKKQTTFFNFVAYVMQMHYKEFIQKSIRKFTEYMCDPEVTYYKSFHFSYNYERISIK